MANTISGAKPDADKAETADKTKSESATAQAEAHKLAITAAEDRAKADSEVDPSKKAQAEKTARESAQKADDAKAKSADLDRKQRGAVESTSVVDAKTLAMVPADMAAGDHRAQKFGNDPANPKHDDTLDPSGGTVRMSRKTPDHTDLVYCDVHPDMVGDYARAGWNRDDLNDLGIRSSARSDRTWQGKNVTIVRAAGQGDQGYDAAKGDQVLVRFDDGTTRVVSRGEVSRREAAAAAEE